MAYQAWSVVFGEQPTAAKWNILGTNDESFHDGTGIDDDAILQRHIADNQILPAQLTSAARWWEELARVTWSSGGVLDTGTFTAKKYLRIILFDTQTSAYGSDIIFNNDSGANYAFARTLEGGAFSSQVSQNSIEFMGNYKGPQMATAEFINIASAEKPGNTTWVSGPRAGTVGSAAQVPTHGEYAQKWTGSAQITRVAATRRSSTNYAAGSELIVLGHD